MMRLTRNALLACLITPLLFTCAQSGLNNEVGANGLPTPRALFSRYVDALGGEAAIRAHSSTTSLGRFSIPAFGVEGSVTAYSAAPDSVSMTIDLSGVGRIESGYNGAVGWSVDPLQGSTLMEGDQLAYMAQQSDYYLPLNLATTFTQQETLGIEQVSGQDAYRVQVQDAADKQATFFYAVDGGLMLRSIATVGSPIGDIEVISDFVEYAEFGGLTVPVVTNINQAGQEISIRFTDISFDNVSANRFDLPAGIQSLLNR